MRRKRSCNVISISYANASQMNSPKIRIQHAKNLPQNNVIISNVIKNTFFRNLEKCNYHKIQSLS